MARVSSDHADESLCVEKMASAQPDGKRPVRGPRLISREEVLQHNAHDGSFWAVVDGFVVDASGFVDSHPGGLKKLLSTNSAATGATGEPFGFSFSRGRNAHFPDTGKQFQAGIKRYLHGAGNEPVLPPAEVTFAKHGKIVILGRLEGR